MHPRAALLPLFAVIAAQCSVNAGAALGKGLFAEIGPEGVAVLRTGIAALVLLAVARPWRRPLGREQLGWLALYGLALGAMNLLIYEAIARIPLGVAVAIEITGPLAVVLATSRSARDLVWFALAAGGVALLVPWPGRAVPLDGAGILFALGAAACWAAYIVFGKQASRVPGLTAVSVGMLFACLVTFPVGIPQAGGALLASHVLALGAVVALLSSALPYALEMRALERMSTRVFGVASATAPAVAALAGLAFLGEVLTGWQALGIAAVTAACAGASLTSAPPVARPREDFHA